MSNIRYKIAQTEKSFNFDAGTEQVFDIKIKCIHKSY